MKIRILAGLLALTAPLCFAGQLTGVTVSKVGFNAAQSNLFYVIAAPVGVSSECGSNFLRLPAVATDPGRALLSMLLSAQATQSKLDLTYTLAAGGICTINDLQLLVSP
jgi:hypothetical protein